ncbi:MAG: preprotein translocase subunit Sec61beta [Candidatus Micrarchaeota archaeon]|jgi:preprotein translocase subunit Sec61beta
MATLGTPQTQAGILSFYDAPEKGPKVGAKLVLIIVVLFTIIVLIFDHFLLAH